MTYLFGRERKVEIRKIKKELHLFSIRYAELHWIFRLIGGEILNMSWAKNVWFSLN